MSQLSEAERLVLRRALEIVESSDTAAGTRRQDGHSSAGSGVPAPPGLSEYTITSDLR